jgi:WD40 repeat protein
MKQSMRWGLTGLLCLIMMLVGMAPASAQLSFDTSHIGVDFAVTASATDPASKYTYLGGEKGELVRYDAKKGRFRQLNTGFTAPISGIVFSRDGKVMFISSTRFVQVWKQNNSGWRVKQLQYPSFVSSVAPSANGKKFAVGVDQDYPISIVDTRNYKLLLSITRGGGNPKLTFYGTQYLIEGNEAGVVRVWNATNGALAPPWLAHPTGVTALTLSRDKSMLATAGNLIIVEDTGPLSTQSMVVVPFTIHLWNPLTGTPSKYVRMPALVTALTFSATGNTIAAGLADGSVRFIDVASGKEVGSYNDGTRKAITALVLNQKGNRLTIANGNPWAIVIKIKSSL